MKTFLEKLESGWIVGDGGTGTMIVQKHPKLHCIESANLEHPETVVDVHLAFIAAGAQIIETNTFGANRFRLEKRDLAEKMHAINSRGVKLAREAREISGKDVYIAGSIGPTGLHLDPLHRDNAERKVLLEAFREQAEALDDRGVDLFVVETFASVYECCVAIDAVRQISSQPIIASLTFPDEWSPSMGGIHQQLLGALASSEVDVIGLNCSMGPAMIVDILESVQSLRPKPISVQPNVGVPVARDKAMSYPSPNPEYFAKFARSAIALGAKVIGGCCGTRPEHIEAISKVVRDHDPASVRPAVSVSAPVAPQEPLPPAPGGGLSPLAQKLADGRFINCIQLDPPKGTNTELCVSAVQRFLEAGNVDAVDVNSNPMARLHMDSLWMSHEIERMGMETVPHITPRDASLMGLEGALLGAWRAGIRNVLVITGDPSQLGGHPGAHDVYQTDGVGLVKVIKELNEGFDCVGNKVGEPPSFCIGVAVNPNAEDIDREIDRFKQKVDNGADFAMTQVFFEWGCWERFLDRFGGKLPIPALVAVWPLTSYRLAVRLHNEVPGIIVPDAYQRELEAAGKGARRVGFDRARKLYGESKDRAAGVYVIAPFKNPAAALEILESTPKSADEESGVGRPAAPGA